MNAIACQCGRNFKTKSGLSRHKNSCGRGRAAAEGSAPEIARCTKCTECGKKDKLIQSLLERIATLERGDPQDAPRAAVLRPVGDPNLSFVTLTILENMYREERVGTPVKLIEFIWMNPEHPENFSIYSNGLEDEIFVYVTGVAGDPAAAPPKWRKETRAGALLQVRKFAYEIVIRALPSMTQSGPVNKTALEQLKANFVDESIFHHEFGAIQRALVAKVGLLRSGAPPP